MTDNQELIKNFLRRWSTIENTPTTKITLSHEIMNLQAITDNPLLEEAKNQERTWFAKKYQEITS